MSRSRFNRSYELTAGRVTITPPRRIEFSANKSVDGGINRLTVRIYNLGESDRLALAKDTEDFSKVIPASLRAGYQGTMHLIFKGTVHRGLNYREGPNFITELEHLDGGYDFLNSFTSATVKGKQKAVDTLLADMPNTGRGKIRTQEPLLRPRVLVGQTAHLLDELLDDEETWYIDNEKLYVIRDDEVVSSYIPVVRADTGLLNTPTREYSKVTFETSMNPTLKIGGLCQLLSKFAPHLNGVYKIYSMGYVGDTHGGDWKQTVTAILAGGYEVL